MELPPVNSVEGAYWYMIGLLLATALALALYVAGVSVGLLPDFSYLF